VNRLMAACDGEIIACLRDRAIVLLSARLGPRAGDVAQLRLEDIEWETGSLRVSGKSRYEVRLPLAQDVGDAIAAYLAWPPFDLPEPASSAPSWSISKISAKKHAGDAQCSARPVGSLDVKASGG
jgi:integrase